MKNPKTIGIQIAKSAGRLVLNLSKKDLAFAAKNTRDIVTEADYKSESLIIGQIKKYFPDHGILSEEMGEARKPSPYRWIIDPIDGTINYASKFEEYCVSIALEFKGKIILGVVYRPVLDQLYVAERGKGAFLNGRRIRVSKKNSLINALVGSDNSSKVPEKQVKNFEILKRICLEVRQIKILGSASLLPCRMAQGQMDCYLKYSTNYWDYAAAALILTEAGGRVTDFTGKPYNERSENIVATNKILHQKFLRLINA